MSDEVTFKANTKPTPFEECIEMIAVAQAVQMLLEAEKQIKARAKRLERVNPDKPPRWAVEQEAEARDWAGIALKAEKFLRVRAPPVTDEMLAEMEKQETGGG